MHPVRLDEGHRRGDAAEQDFVRLHCDREPGRRTVGSGNLVRSTFGQGSLFGGGRRRLHYRRCRRIGRRRDGREGRGHG